MTNEQDTRCAELLGLVPELRHWHDTDGRRCPPSMAEILAREFSPSTILEHARWLEEALTARDLWHHYLDVLMHRNGGPWSDEDRAAFLAATPEQRTIAFIAVMEAQRK